MVYGSKDDARLVKECIKGVEQPSKTDHAESIELLLAIHVYNANVGMCSVTTLLYYIMATKERTRQGHHARDRPNERCATTEC